MFHQRPYRFIRNFIVPSILGLCLLFSGCEQQQAPANQAKIVAITVPGTPWYDSWMTLQQRLDQIPGTPLKPVFYISGQLGSEESTLSQLRRGRVHIGGFSLQGASSIVPELGLLLAPYLFDSLAEVDFVMDHYLSDTFSDMFAQQGLVLLGWAEVGWTNVYSRDPILTPADSAHKKLRSSNALSSQLFVQAIGADMVPLPFPDIMPSLQTGLIDGGESGSIFYALAGIPKEAPHLTLTRHAFDTGMFLANKAWFDQLTEERRQALRRSLPTLDELRQSVRNAEATLLADPQSHNVTIHKLNAAQRQQWRQATAKNHDLLIEKIGGNSATIYQLLMQGKRDFTQRQSP
ncbi:TRAP transporter substrate-binding protein [Oceanicoccus sp. KOV_DT_Chl]|uniref:TRAP transporter substrate-binding protein n=1 Tax=Oceanicoccus sp. KOV_DT_Chl TaxID=1904639 RepID=UPI000C7DF004|nr:TRAP transporter substrate-binding protein DctP [Oceanicoccus sp. KOV_DT_Chl]